jgi:hypothetical protein
MTTRKASAEAFALRDTITTAGRILGLVLTMLLASYGQFGYVLVMLILTFIQFFAVWLMKKTLRCLGRKNYDPS